MFQTAMGKGDTHGKQSNLEVEEKEAYNQKKEVVGKEGAGRTLTRMKH